MLRQHRRDAEKGGAVNISERQQLATLLDLRTVGASHMSSEQKANALDLLENTYANFALRAYKYGREKQAASEAKAEAEATAARAEAAASGKARAAEVDEQKPKLDSCASYGARAWSDEEEESVGELEGEPPDEMMLRDGYLSEARRFFKAWRRLPIDWPKEFPDAKLQAPFDLVNDLMPLDIGQLYRKIHETDADRKTYGWLPLMASCSVGQLGALNAETRELLRARVTLCWPCGQRGQHAPLRRGGRDGGRVAHEPQVHGLHAHKLLRPLQGAGMAALWMHCG